MGWDNLQHDEGLKINIYGKSGSGKTTFCATAPGPIRYLICSGDLRKPGEMRSIDTPENREKITPVVITKLSDLEAELAKDCASGEYQTVVLDHATGLQDLAALEVTGWSEMPTQLARGNDRARTISQPQWGEITYRSKEILRDLLSLPCNIIIVAQEREYKPQGDSDLSDLILPNICAALTPSLAGWLNQAVDYIVNTFIRPKYIVKEQSSKVPGGKVMITRTPVKGKVEYCLRVGPHAVYTTKFRAPRSINEALPECIVDPTFDKVVALIQGKKV